MLVAEIELIIGSDLVFMDILLMLDQCYIVYQFCKHCMTH